MSQPCAVATCKRASRALCHCCNQNLCRDHLNEHDDLLNAQLHPFADEVNQLGDQFNNISVNDLVKTAHEQLHNFRIDSHRRIDQYVDEKQRQLDEYINVKMSHQSEELLRIRTIISQLIQKQETTMDDLNSISLAIHSIQQEITGIKYKSIDLNINQLEIDDRLIQIGEGQMKKEFNFSTLMPPLQIINRSAESPKPLISNNRVLLTHHENQLCLFDQDLIIIKSIPWIFGWIWDMCWSSTLSRFFIITLKDIFMLDENTMALERLKRKEEYSPSSCTCSDTSLYIATNELGSSIYEFKLSPTIELVNRWQPADLCNGNEIIQDIVFHKGTLALIIENQRSHTKRMDMRVANTFDQLWSHQFDIIDPLHNAYRLCLFNYNEWLVIDWKSSQLFYITEDGQMKSTCIYEPVPYRCCQFGPNMLAISAKTSINFHKI